MPCTGMIKRRCKNDPECKWVVGEGCKMTTAAAAAQRKLTAEPKRTAVPKRTAAPLAKPKRAVVPKRKPVVVSKPKLRDASQRPSRSVSRSAARSAARSASRSRSPLYIPSPVPVAPVAQKPKGGIMATAMSWLKGTDKPPVTTPSTPASQLPLGCKPSNKAKYLLRNSPAYPANECCGVILPGKDGRQYISRPDKNGVCHWHKL
jgi:hypothetical protein